MRILIVSQYYYPELISVNEIAEELLKRGHKVSVITDKPNYGYKKILDEYKDVDYEILNGVDVYRINLKPRKNSRFSIYENYLSFYFNAKRFINKFKEKFDIVLSFSLSPVISIAPAIKYAKKNNIPHLLMCEDLWPESVLITNAVKENSLKYKILYKWSNCLYKKCDDIAISSPSFKEYFYKVHNIKDKSFEYINQPVIESKNETIKPIKYKDKYNIVYAGNIGKIQLIDNLLSSMKLLKNDEIVLHLMGMGSELDNILKRIKDENIQNVIYHGPLKIEEAERYYVNADALIVSLKNKGYVGKTIPNKAIQYLKYKRPIIGVVGGDAYDMLKAAKGTYFSNEGPNEVAATIKTVVNLGKEQKDILGLNNFKYFKDNFETSKIVDKLEKKLKSMIKNS